MSALATKGRPRDPQVDNAIVVAALDVLADRGFARFTVEEVATAAGVGKASIYRRFADKDALITHTLDHVNDDLPPIPDEGTARDRLAIMMDRVRRGIPHSRAGRIMQHVLGESTESPHLVSEFYRRVMEPRRNRIRSVLLEGKNAGELSADFDVEVAIAALVGSMVFLSTWAGCDGVDETSTRDVVDLVLS
jgi:AcrR family transcriptional regulator